MAQLYKLEIKCYHSPSPLASANEFVYDLLTVWENASNVQGAYEDAQAIGVTVFGANKSVFINVTEEKPT